MVTLLSSDSQWEFSVKRSDWSGALAGSPYLAQLEIVLNQRAPSQYQKPSDLILSTSGGFVVRLHVHRGVAHATDAVRVGGRTQALC